MALIAPCACAAALVLLIFPASAGACPSLSNVRSFKGTASISFSQARTREDYEPGFTWPSNGTWHAAFEQTAAGLQLKSLRAQPTALPVAVAGRRFSGRVSGGMVGVKDSMVQYEEEGAAGSEAGSGPSGRYGGGATIQLGGRFGKARTGEELGCGYVLKVGYSIAPNDLIKEAGKSQLAIPTQRSFIAVAQTPAETIASNLHLSGLAEIKSGVILGTNSTPGGYLFEGPVFRVQDLSGITEEGLNEALIQWNLRPVFAQRHH